MVPVRSCFQQTVCNIGVAVAMQLSCCKLLFYPGKIVSFRFDDPIFHTHDDFTKNVPSIVFTVITWNFRSNPKELGKQISTCRTTVYIST